jgi:hypothetical protein
MKCPTCGKENKFYATGCDEFDAAIIKFGVDAALEYFATPEKEKHNFDSLREKPKNETPNIHY